MRDKTWSTTTKVDRSLPMTVWHLHGNFSLQNIILAWYSYWLYGIVVRISSTRVQANYWSVSLLMMLYSVTNCTWPDSLRRVICKHTYHENDRCICDGFYAKRGHDVIITTWLYIIFFLVIMFIIFTNDLLINVFTVLIDYFIFFIILIIIFNGQQYLAV